jgi:thiol-disulfide isomerase/thioredoxin
MELERRPCGLPGADHLCVVLDVPLKRWVRNTSPNNVSRMLEGTSRLILDTETGLLIARRTVETVDNQRGPYQSDVTYSLKQMTYGTAPDTTAFQLQSSDMKEVKELSRWDAAKIKKRLVGRPASELEVTDIQGKPVTLSSYQGKLVLLDFWTTWCPPCRADAPALDKLYRKYGDKDLIIVGISVSEERAIVEKFLKEHPHSFPIVLTTGNDMPRQYQIGVFPTYIVIERDGTVASAAEGDQGFSELRKLLKKAGLEVE